MSRCLRRAIEGALGVLLLAVCSTQDAIARTPNDVRFGEQWALQKINAPKAWDVTIGSEDIIIAIVDTGVDTLHPDLKGKLVRGYDFVNNRPDQNDDNGHGTHVAGIAAAITNDGLVNSAGIAGVAWKCKIMPIKVLNKDKIGKGEAIAQGIRYATANGAQVINLSLQSGYPDVQAAVKEAYQKGCVVVAASGNDNQNVIVPPAIYNEVIAVGATDKDDNRAKWDLRTDPSALWDFITTQDPSRFFDGGSDYGPQLDVVAPGKDVLSDVPSFVDKSGYIQMKGTSLAAPHVSGLAALILSKYPTWTPDRVKAQIQATADKVPAMKGQYWTEEYGYGRINAYRALTEFVPLPVITSSLQITPASSYYVGNTISATFTITNQGSGAITFSRLTVGGRLNGDCPNGNCPDFELRNNVTLNYGESYIYRGALTLSQPGNYHFFCAYQTPDSNWNTNVVLAKGLIVGDRERDVTVTAPLSPSSPPPGGGVARPDIITTIAGSGDLGFSGDGGSATQARLNSPEDVAVDAKGNVYIADSGNNRIRRVGPDGIITTFAGEGSSLGDGGPAVQASLGATDVAVDAQGNVYIADEYDHRVRRVGPDGIITTFAGTGEYGFSGDGGPAIRAKLYHPSGVAVDAKGNVYIASPGNQRIRRVGPNGVITTFAGSGEVGNNGYVKEGFSGDGGPAVQAKLYNPSGVAVDPQGNVYIADEYNHRVRRVGPDGIITTFAGTGEYGFSGDGGPAVQAKLSGTEIAVDSQGNVYIADSGNHRVRRVGPDGIITTFAGTGYTKTDPQGNIIGDFSGDGGPAIQARLYNPSGVAVDAKGNVYIADTYNHRIRRVGINEPFIRLSASSLSLDDVIVGAMSQKTFKIYNTGSGTLLVTGITLDKSDGQFMVSPTTLTVAPGDSQTVKVTFTPTSAGTKTATLSIAHNAPGSPSRISLSGAAVADEPRISLSAPSLILDDVIVGAMSQKTFKINNIGSRPLLVTGILVDGADAAQFTVSPTTATIVVGQSQVVTVTFAPTSIGAKSARMSITHNAFGTPTTIDLSGTGLEGPTAQDGPLIITTIAGTGNSGFSGDGGPAIQAKLNSPQGVAVDTSRNIYILDKGNSLIRRVGSDGVITTTFGNVSVPRDLSGIATGPDGSVYITERDRNRIIRVGSGNYIAEGYLNQPSGLTVGSDGTIYVADAGSIRILGIRTDGSIYVFAGGGLLLDDTFGDNGPATKATLNLPTAVSRSGSTLYIAETGNLRTNGVIRRVIGGSSGNIIQTVIGESAGLSRTLGVAAGPNETVYIADAGNNSVLQAVVRDRTATSIGGSLNRPSGVAVGPDGSVYIADTGNNRILRVDKRSIRLSTSSLAFNNTSVKAAPQKTLTIGNPGIGSLSITGITVGGVDASLFTVSPTTALIPTGQSLTVTVTFAPTSVGEKVASLSIIHNATESPLTVALSGTGVELSGSVDFEQRAILKGHTNRVRSVAFSSDGKLLASAGEDSTVRLWDVAQQKLVGVLEGHTDVINSLAFSPDGKLLAVGGGHAAYANEPFVDRDNTVRLWDVARQKLVGVLEGHTNTVNSIAFSPDGSTLISAGEDNTVRLWDVAQQKQMVNSNGSGANAVAFSPDGKLVALGEINQIEVTHIDSVPFLLFRPVVLLHEYFGTSRFGVVYEVYSVAFSPDGKLLASGDDLALGDDSDYAVRLWDVSTWEQVAVLKGHANTVNSVAFSPDGKILVSAGEDNTVRLWDVEQRVEGKILTGVGGPVAFSPDGKLFATTGSGSDNTVRLWGEFSAPVTSKVGDGTAVLDLNTASGDQSSRTMGGVKPGQKVDVQILLNKSYANASGFLVVLTFDPTKVSVVGWKKDGTAFANAIDLPAQTKADSVTYGASILGGSTTAIGSLAILTFQAASSYTGDMEITLKSVQIRVAGVINTLVPGASVVLSSSAPALVGDFNNDGVVNFDDFFLFASVFGTKKGDPNFDPQFDLDSSGAVDFGDFFIFADAFGKKQ